MGICTKLDWRTQLSDEPAQGLKGDLFFISNQMGLKYPLQHLGKSRGELNM